MTYSKFINCLDLEMEFSRPEGKQIIEIGLCVIDAEKREIVKSYSYPIKYPNRQYFGCCSCLSCRNGLNGGVFDVPEANIVTPEITDLTGWTEKKLNKQGEPLAKVCERLKVKHGSKNRIVVVDCADEFDCFGKDNPFGKNIFNISDMFRIKTKQFRGVSLHEMINHFGQTFEGKQHRADVDSRAIASIFLELTK